MEIDSALTNYDLVNMNKLLNQKILDQNEKLKRYNETLEDTIKNRTLDLEIQNRVLELSREILENIPAPVIGVSEDRVIALLNRKAANLSFAGKNLTAGCEFADYFPDSMSEVLGRSLVEKESFIVRDYAIGEDKFGVDFTPLSGEDNRNGVILLFNRKNP